MDLPNQGSHFFGGLPFGQLTKTFLTGPDTCVDNFEEQLTSSRVENENGTIDRFGGEISLESFVNSDTIDIGIIDKPNDLIGEQFTIIL